MKIWTCRSCPRSGSQNAWTWIKNVNGAIRLSNFWNFFWRGPNDFLSRLVTMDETRLHHYDLETKEQSVEWWHSGLPCPKKFWVQKSAGKILALIFWDQDITVLTDYLAKGQTINAEYTHLCWCNWRTCWRKSTTWRSPRGSCSFTTMPQLTGHLEPTRNWPLWASSVLVTHPVLWIWPCRTTTCSLDWKNHFSSNVEVIAAVETWLDGQPSEFFFEWLAEVRATGYEVYWALCGVCLINPEFGHCSLFPSWSG